jgi:phosphate-selective porin OprO/OprP
VGYSRWGNRWQVSAGAFGQAPPDVDATGQDEATGLTGRFTIAPILGDRRLLHFGVAASKRTPNAGAAADANQARFRARPETMVNRARFLSTGKIKDVDHTSLYNAEMAAVAGPVSIQAEYTLAAVRRLNGLKTAKFDGGYAFISVFLTGESRPYLASEGEFDRIIPRSRHGALELAARYSRMSLNDDAVGVAILGGKGTNFTLGANWYFNSNFKLQANYVRVVTDENAKPDQGTAPLVAGDKFNILQVRWALSF